MDAHFSLSKLVAGLVGVFAAAGIDVYFSGSIDVTLYALGLVMIVNSWVFSAMTQLWWIRFVVLLALVVTALLLALSIHDPSKRIAPQFVLAAVSGILLVTNIVMYFRKRRNTEP